MSSNTLVDKITAEADVEVAAIKAAADAEVAEIKRETTAALEVLRAEAKSALEKKQMQQALVVTAKAKQDGKLQVQRAKRAALNEIFAAVEKDFLAQSADSYVAFFTEQVKRVVPAGVAVTAVTAPAARLEETNAILSALSMTAEVTSDTTIKAGLIMTTADGVYDVSFERLYNLARPELEMRVVSEFVTS